MEKKVVEVVITGRNINSAFDYYLPPDLNVRIGDYVKVPFGRGNHYDYGWVISLKEKSQFPNLKPVLKNYGKIIPDFLWQLAFKMSQFYRVPLGIILPVIFPLTRGILEDILRKKVILLVEGLDLNKFKLNSPQKKVLSLLQEGFLGNKTEIARKIGISLSPINTLLKKGILKEGFIQEYKLPYANLEENLTPLSLAPSQQEVFSRLFQSFLEKEEFLLYGVTGSGKTYLYLKMIDEVLKSKGEIIYLVPEISLTPQLVRLLKERYGKLVAVFHSRLSPKERVTEWLRMYRGEVKICIGARSAVFAPFSNLKLIIVDEEGESSYKQSDNPRYEVKDIIKLRKEISPQKIFVIYGSATPSIEVFHRFFKNEIPGGVLKRRYQDVSFPEINVVDMRKEVKKGNRTIFSELLRLKIEEKLSQKEQIIIFHNRRAYSTYVFCRNCGYEERCPDCSVALKYYFREKLLRCNYCDYTKSIPRLCPECGSKHIKYYGMGTEKVEQKLKELYPRSRILRVDSDNVNTLSKHERIFKKIKNGEVDIIVGTQMISRGLHFPNITLVGVLLYDSLLSLPDYLASYRAFSLLTQVGGRAGRGEKTGNVVVQTFNPYHYTIKAALKNDYYLFYEKEIEKRQKLFYPPFSNLINVVFSSEKERELAYFCEKVGGFLRDSLRQVKLENEIFLLGPAPAPLEKLNKNYRWQLLFKISPDIKITDVSEMIFDFLEKFKIPSFISFYLDINPNSLL